MDGASKKKSAIMLKNFFIFNESIYALRLYLFYSMKNIHFYMTLVFLSHLLCIVLTYFCNIILNGGQVHDTPSKFHSRNTSMCIQSDVSKRMEQIRRGCEEICDNSITGTPSLFFDQVKKKIDCHGLWMNEAIDQAMIEPYPPPWIPEEMVGAFTYGGRVQIRPWGSVLNDRYLEKTAMQHVWTRDTIDDWTMKCHNGELDGNYGVSEVRQLKLGLGQMNLSGASVLVIGSEIPWVEACVLDAGASLVTTLEYGEIISEHPRVKTVTPSQFRARYSEYNEIFDAVVTFSSVEHSGLGRYGDAMNPWGDRQAIARAWCASKPGARLLTAVMTGVDEIVYNAHRVYGPIMYPHLVANWEQIWRATEGLQVVHVFRKSHWE